MKTKLFLILLFATAIFSAKSSEPLSTLVTDAEFFTATAEYEILPPSASEPIHYRATLIQQTSPTDSLLPFRYIIETEQPDGDRFFSAYFDGNFFRYRGEKMREWHYSENPEPFRAGVQRTEMFVDLLPGALRATLEQVEADTANRYSVERNSEFVCIQGSRKRGGIAEREYTYTFSPAGLPLSTETVTNPGQSRQQSVRATYSYTDNQTGSNIDEARLIEMYPEAFAKFREGNFSVESLEGRALPSYSARTLSGERKSYRRGEKTSKPTLMLFLDLDSATRNIISEVVSALSASKLSAEVFYVFESNRRDIVAETAGGVCDDADVIVNASSMMADFGITHLPAAILVDADGKVDKIVECVNNQQGEFVRLLNDKIFNPKQINHTNMSTVYFNSTPVDVYGSLPVVGSIAPDFHLTSNSLTDISMADFPGKRIVLNIFPSLDTEVCAASVRRFNQDATKVDNVAVLCVSMDLPFAMSRFCTINGLENVVPASAFRSPEFAKDYGVMMVDGPLKGLLARAVVVLDEDGRVLYRELVEEITHEPDYEAALSVLKKQ